MTVLPFANSTHVAHLVARYPSLAETAASIEDALHLMADSFSKDCKILLCGNGGSAADCEHIVGELMKGFLLPRKIPTHHRLWLAQHVGPSADAFVDHLQRALPAIALTSQGALATAIGNDNGPELAFAQQLYGLGRAGDTLLGISTSGNARNVLHAFHVARMLGLRTVLLTGRTGGLLAPLADVAIRVPADKVYEIQELHVPVYHTLCIALEEHFFGSHSSAPNAPPQPTI